MPDALVFVVSFDMELLEDVRELGFDFLLRLDELAVLLPNPAVRLMILVHVIESLTAEVCLIGRFFFLVDDEPDIASEAPKRHLQVCCFQSVMFVERETFFRPAEVLNFREKELQVENDGGNRILQRRTVWVIDDALAVPIVLAPASMDPPPSGFAA